MANNSDNNKKRRHVVNELLPFLGIDFAAQGKKKSRRPLPETASPASAESTSDENITPQVDASATDTGEMPPVTDETSLIPVAAAEETVTVDTPLPVTPSAPAQEEIEPVIEDPVASDTPPVNTEKAENPLPSVTEIVAVPLATVLQNDPGLPPAELEKRRAQAYQEMAPKLAEYADTLAVDAYENGYTKFRCDLLVKGPQARIRMLFQSDKPGKLPREEFFDLNKPRIINGYDHNAYTRLGVLPKTDAINLFIIVNSQILGDDSFSPILSNPKNRTVRERDSIPKWMLDPERRKTRNIPNASGIYQLEVTDQSSKSDIKLHFGLGVSENTPNAEDIAKDRASRLLGELDRHNADYITWLKRNAGGRGRQPKVYIPNKGELQKTLENSIGERRNQYPEDPLWQWAYPTRIELLANDRELKIEYLKLTDPSYQDSLENKKNDPAAKKERQEMRAAIPPLVECDEDWKEALSALNYGRNRKINLPFPAPGNNQRTTLVGVALSKKGSNRTYHLDINLYVNDDPSRDEKGDYVSTKAGHYVGSIDLNLCIEDPEIARIRAQEVLYGSQRNTNIIRILQNYFRQRPQASWALNEHKKLTENLEEEVRLINDTIKEQVDAFNRMLKEELPITNRTRYLHIERRPPHHHQVAIHAQIRENDQVIKEVVFSVPESQADITERFARGDMDKSRRNHILKDLILRFEHDLSVKVEQGEVKEGEIPVTFSVMRGKRDGKLEQHLDKDGKPVRVTKLVPEKYKPFLSSGDPEKDGWAEAVDKHMGLLSAIHYSPIIPKKPFIDTLSEEELKKNLTSYHVLKEKYESVKQDRDGFRDQPHPEFNPDLPKRWLEHAVTSNMYYHLPGITDREVRNGHGGGHGKNNKPNGIRERFPSVLQEVLRDKSLYPDDPFIEDTGKGPRPGRRI